MLRIRIATLEFVLQFSYVRWFHIAHDCMVCALQKEHSNTLLFSCNDAFSETSLLCDGSVFVANVKTDMQTHYKKVLQHEPHDTESGVQMRSCEILGKLDKEI